jgi:sugar fermentation stimulation protein A
MEFPHPLVSGRLLRRYKRFLADVAVDGAEVTVHCPNSGSMAGLSDPGSLVWLSRAKSAARRLPYTLELVEADCPSGVKSLVGVNTGVPNRLVEEALGRGVIGELRGYSKIRREVRYGANSRVDFVLEGDMAPNCYVEVKNVHLCRTPGLAEFPDCVTARGAKHLRELSAIAKEGMRAVMFFCVQRTDCTSFDLAPDLDPAYSHALEEAVASGVETLVYKCHISLSGIDIAEPIEFRRERELRSLETENWTAPRAH